MAKTGRGKEKNAAKAQAEAASTAAKKAAETSMVLIAPAALRALLKQDDNYKDQIYGLTGELREAIGNAVEKKKLDKKAYAAVKRFHREKSNEKLANLWNTLLAYMEMAGIMERINSVSALPLDGEPASEEEGSEDDEAEIETDAEIEASPGDVVTPQFGGRGRRAPASTH